MGHAEFYLAMTALIAGAIVIIVVSLFIFRYQRSWAQREHEQYMQRMVNEAAESAAATRTSELRVKLEAQNERDAVLKQISTEYVLYCADCGKVLTLQHASRLPTELQEEVGYIPPPEEPTRKRKKD